MNSKQSQTEASNNTPLLFIEQSVSAGFPNPCDEFLCKPISLDALLIKRASSTFLVRVTGTSMEPTIPCGAIVIVDKSIRAITGSIVVAVVDNEFILKELRMIKNSTTSLHSHNNAYKDIVIDESNEDRTEIWGVVTSFVKQL
jgi:DNA polymerase V